MFDSILFTYEGTTFILEFDISRNEDTGHLKIKMIKRRSATVAFPFATISQEFDGVELAEDEILVNTFPLYEELITFLKNETDYFEETNRYAMGEYGSAPIWRVKFNFD